jgi:hypothetical protein
MVAISIERDVKIVIFVPTTRRSEKVHTQQESGENVQATKRIGRKNSDCHRN